jgi:N-acyl-L-homoserine lactone synthetase
MRSPLNIGRQDQPYMPRLSQGESARRLIYSDRTGTVITTAIARMLCRAAVVANGTGPSVTIRVERAVAIYIDVIQS